ncbi:MAG: transpeptidase family protein [Bacteroidales bacterium]|nr:transpeptidase family protein [Bacteroidales bacterium]
MILVGIGILIKAAVIMFFERSYWESVAKRLERENVITNPNRGNILSADGKLMASSLPEYRIYMDFKTCKSTGSDSLLLAHLNEIAQGMHKILPDRSVSFYKNRILQGRKINSQNFLLYPKPISYIQYKEIKELPVFNLRSYTGGFHVKEYKNQRKRPFGTLAQRTLGDVFLENPKIAKNGIERAYDSLLRGKTGIVHRQKVRNRYIDIVDEPAVDGCDILTTLDVDMQDICEKALVDKLYEVNANSGVAILMEVETGDIKAIVNMSRGRDGKFYEMQNNAISDMYEPGSVFKTASLMVALEDGKVNINDSIKTGNGVYPMHGRLMKDHNHHRGGYGTISLTEAFKYSSNIGISLPIDRAYQDNKQKFFDGLKRLGLTEPLQLQIEGEGVPYVKNPGKGEFVGTTLPWMSIGYETQFPPLNILNFYNAIANNGKMMRPRLVTAAVKDGKVIEEYKTKVMNPSIASAKTIKQIQELLKLVVSEGTGKPAQSEHFPIAGKTGTAQISKGKKGYRSGVIDYNMNFCGYFPADNPKYSCMISIQRSGPGSFAANMCGPVFRKIAERVYAKDLKLDVLQAKDSTSVVVPHIKRGEMMEALYVLNELDIETKRDFITDKKKKIWGSAKTESNLASLESKEIQQNKVPNVKGMGAKDAVFLLEQLGLQVRLSGVGHVTKQSINEGSSIKKGQTISLILN